MARLPQPGGDVGNWGDILNDYLSQSLQPDGTLKNNVVTSAQLSPGAITKADVGLGNVDNTSDANKPVSSATLTALNAKLDSSQKGVANGVAPLDSSTKLPESVMPDRLSKSGLDAGYATVVTPLTLDADGLDAAWSKIVSLAASGTAPQGGTIYLPPGSLVTLDRPLSWNIADPSGPASGVQLSIQAYGAKISCTDPSAPYGLELYTTSGTAGQPRPRIFGGWWDMTNRSADVPAIRIRDVRGAKLQDLKVTAYTAIQLYNWDYYVERTVIRDLEERGCAIAVDFVPPSVSGGSSSTDSFARTTIDGVFLQGGLAFIPKIRCRGNVYHSNIKNISGNVPDDCVIIEFSGSFGGTLVEYPQIETNGGVTHTGTLLSYNNMTGEGPVVYGRGSTLGSVTRITGSKPFQPPYFKTEGVFQAEDATTARPSYGSLNEASGVGRSGDGTWATYLLGSKVSEWSIVNGLTHYGQSDNAADKAFRTQRLSDTLFRFNLRTDGLMQWGDGTSAVDTTLLRKAAHILGMNNGDSFKVDGAWNGGMFIMGAYYLWFDATGQLRAKNGTPTSDLDGFLVGTGSLEAWSTVDSDPVTNSTAFVTSTTLTVPVVANATYKFSAEIHYLSSVTADLKLAWTTPSGSDGRWVVDGLQGGIATGNSQGSVVRQNVGITGSGTAGGSDSVELTVTPSGMFTTAGTAGNFALQYAQSTADAAFNTYIRKWSHLSVTRIA